MRTVTIQIRDDANVAGIASVIVMEAHRRESKKKDAPFVWDEGFRNDLCDVARQLHEAVDYGRNA